MEFGIFSAVCERWFILGISWADFSGCLLCRLSMILLKLGRSSFLFFLWWSRIWVFVIGLMLFTLVDSEMIHRIYKILLFSFVWWYLVFFLFFIFNFGWSGGLHAFIFVIRIYSFCTYLGFTCFIFDEPSMLWL